MTIELKWYITIESIFLLFSLIYVFWNYVDGELFLAFIGMFGVGFFGSEFYKQFRKHLSYLVFAKEQGVNQ